MAKRLESQKLVKSYSGRRVVDGVSMSVQAGEIVGLLGPNGAGKTTSFYMCVGLIAPDEGSVVLNGQDITREPMYSRARLGLGYLPQEASVFRKLSVEDNIMAILETIDFSSKMERKKKLENLLSELSLEHLRKTMASALSGGERRRTEIARALARDPDFILLDEPFAGIDPKVVKEIQKIILKLKKQGIGILITDHNFRETLDISDKAYVMAEGKVIEEGDKQAIYASDLVKTFYLGRD